MLLAPPYTPVTKVRTGTALAGLFMCVCFRGVKVDGQEYVRVVKKLSCLPLLTGCRTGASVPVFHLESRMML